MRRRSLLVVLTIFAAGCIRDLSSANSSTGDTGEVSTTTTTTATTSPTSSTTTDEPGCGNGQADPGEQCDDGNTTPGDGCENDCTTTPGEMCGNGVKDPGEDCDDGNQVNGDGCENNCRITPDPKCGDNTVDPGEQCDDGNTVSGDGCESNCSKTPMCGDGIVGPGEQCDDGNMEDDDACLTTCAPASCGDGHVFTGSENCDDGAKNGDYGACLDDCSGPGPSCGDGTRNGPEECDDANQIDDDACANDCIAPRLAFVTADDFKGNLGGVLGADAKCATAAMGGLLPTNVEWRAWISDATTSPATAGRMDTEFTGYYKLTNGAVLAHGWTDLSDGTLAQPLNVDEAGNPAVDPLAAWSNTAASGANAGTQNCENWSSAALLAQGRYGDVSVANTGWSDAAAGNPMGCSSSFHLYCFQNSAAP